ncbi:hypothetical protein [Paenibacillus sp. FSL W7-1287]|uniref:hypothetical protein n=1 Tax=Paenibacillus sp. FSL W7-1287 TaxID=2954538 RepID=UPI0030F7F3F9
MKLLYYIPAVLLLVVIVFVNTGWIKATLGCILACCVLIAKFMRYKNNDEIEVDERVKTNIHYYSFGFIVVMNSLLACYFFLISNDNMDSFMTPDYLLIYLAISIVVPLYIIPSIAKRL